MATQMTSPPTAIIAAARARSMSAKELGDFIIAECNGICVKLASLKPYVRVAFERIDKGEAICGHTSKTAFCERVLGRTYNAVKFMQAGGNPCNGRKVFTEVQTEVIAALVSKGRQHREAVSLVESAKGENFKSLFKSALAKRSGLRVVPDPATQPVPPTTNTTAPTPDIKPDININVVASELIRDLESASRLAKLKAVVDSRQRLNPTLWRDLLRALNNAGNTIINFEKQLSKDFKELPPTGKCHQRIVREQNALQPDPDEQLKREAAKSLANASVREISYAEAKNVILANEYLASMGTTRYTYGLFFKHPKTGVEYIGGVECFGSTSGSNTFASICGPKHKDEVIAVVRGACLPWADHEVLSKGKVHTGAAASYLIARACKLMTKKGYSIFVAYSDPDACEIGGTYQSVGWKYCGMTHPTEKYTTLDGKIHDSRQISGRTRDRRGGGLRYIRSRAEEKQLLIGQGCKFSKGTQKYRYVGFYGNKQTKIALQEALRWKTFPYPKRPTQAAFEPQPVPPHTHEESSQAS